MERLTLPKTEVVNCDYDGCDNSYPISEMEGYDWDGGTWYACLSCVDKLEDRTGYCGVPCMFGRGCTQSC